MGRQPELVGDPGGSFKNAGREWGLVLAVLLRAVEWGVGG